MSVVLASPVSIILPVLCLFYWPVLCLLSCPEASQAWLGTKAAVLPTGKVRSVCHSIAHLQHIKFQCQKLKGQTEIVQCTIKLVHEFDFACQQHSGSGLQ